MKAEHICGVCAVPMRLAESIDGGGDTIERYECPKCGKESYLGTFVYRPPGHQTASTPEGAGVFKCKRCGVRTAGIVLDVRSECRWCPACQSPLFQYPDCCRERLEQKGKLCPTCQALQVVKGSKPSIDERTSATPRGGAWS